MFALAPFFSLVKVWTDAYIRRVPKQIAEFFVMLVVLASLSASPAIMASSLHSAIDAGSADACALCQASACDHSQPVSATAGCMVAVCAMLASVNTAGLLALPHLCATLVLSMPAHRGRLLEGPEPFPPRSSHA